MSVTCRWSSEGGGRGGEGVLGAGGLEREHLCLGVDMHEISPGSNLSFGSYYEKSSLGFDKSVSRAALALATRLEG